MIQPKLPGSRPKSGATKRGAFVTIKWEEWTSSQQPNYDPTTGAMLTVGTEDVPLTAMLKTRAFTHFVGPTTSRARIFAEIKEGDCIMDFVIPILQIADAGRYGLHGGPVG